jgi:hypothetical protein
MFPSVSPPTVGCACYLAAPSPHSHRRRPKDEEDSGPGLRYRDPSPTERRDAAAGDPPDRDPPRVTPSAKGCFPAAHIGTAGLRPEVQLVERRDETEEGVARERSMPMTFSTEPVAETPSPDTLKLT